MKSTIKGFTQSSSVLLGIRLNVMGQRILGGSDNTKLAARYTNFKGILHMKRLALAATLAATAFAAPAFADGHTTQFAIMHFNMDADSTGDRRMTPTGLTTVDLSAGSTLADVFAHLNMDADTSMDVTGDGPGVTIVMSDPAHAAEIFRRLMAESMGDDR